MDVSLTDAPQLTFYFLVYSVLGWLLEQGYQKRKKGHWAGKGFLSGPYKPMYGFAPVLLLLLIGPDTPWWWTLSLALAVPTVVEYVSGKLLKVWFHRQYWNYADCRFQLEGLICLRFSLYWAVLCLALVMVLHPATAWLYERFIIVWSYMWGLAAVWLLLDLVRTVFMNMSREPESAK